MPKFSERSQRNLNSCHPALVKLFEEVVKHFDCKVTCGHRTEIEQNKAFDSATTTKRWPDSKHNSSPSLAVDVVPYPVDWNNRERFLHFTGFVLGMATAQGIKLRLGIDWDGDHHFNDQHFHDGPHFELVLYEG